MNLDRAFDQREARWEALRDYQYLVEWYREKMEFCLAKSKDNKLSEKQKSEWWELGKICEKRMEGCRKKLKLLM